MDILIRKIQRKGKTLVFMPNSKSGYKFETEDAQPCLTEFQKSCIQTKAQKDRKLGSFWTPNFCCIGALMVQNGQANLSDMIGRGSSDSMTSFNNHFPDKNWYWYDKAKPENLAMLTYFIGVRAAASILAYYYNLLKTSKIKEAERLYKRHLLPLGMARLLVDADSNLVSDEDDLYMIEMSGKDYIIKTDLCAKNKHEESLHVGRIDTNKAANNQIGKEEPVKPIIKKPSYVHEGVASEVIKDSDKSKSMSDDTGASVWDKPLNIPKGIRAAIAKPETQPNSTEEFGVSEEDTKSKKNPNKLPRMVNNE
jgi:hypothetical protein